jgi:hypothetical protein
MKKCVVITTVRPPTQGILAFLDSEYDVIIVGDQKTPDHYHNMDCIFLDIKTQQQLFPILSQLLPFNHYARKNLGYLYAIQHGYDIIAESDDDNVPMSHWGTWNADFSDTVVAPQYPNIYRLYTDVHIWGRGFPLDKIRQNEPITIEHHADNTVFIIQGLVNHAPDVDAIFRLVMPNAHLPIHFEKNGQYALGKGVLSPFNSQNTIWLHKTIFPCLYLPNVSFRYSDILRSYITQFVLWQLGGQLAFIAPNMIQRRNPHDVMQDFVLEIPIYQHFHTVMHILTHMDGSQSPTILFTIYETLVKEGIVARQELDIVERWLNVVLECL